MAQFTFRLQTLLDQKVENAKKAWALVVAKQTVLDAEEALWASLKEKEKEAKRLALRMRDELLLTAVPTKESDIQRRRSYLEGLQQDMKAAHNDVLIQKFAVTEAKSAVELAETAAQYCEREAKVFRKFKEKQEKRFLADLAKKEELDQDEQGTVTFLARRSSR